MFKQIIDNIRNRISSRALSTFTLLAILAIPVLAFAAEGSDDSSLLLKSIKQFSPIAILLAVVAIVLVRLPKVELGHSDAFLRRRVLNWLPLGLTYAFLYMGRYNLTVSKKAFGAMTSSSGEMMSNTDFGVIFMVGTIVYGCSFVINGPLTDRLGGKFSILLGAAGSAVANLLMGLCTLTMLHHGPASDFVVMYFVPLFACLYGLNMYFQSFGAVAIVKTNAAWFHVRERGVFGSIFGILISLGVYFAFDWGAMIRDGLGVQWVFFIPAIMLTIFWVLDYYLVFNTPGDAGQKDFDTADASSGDEGPALPAVVVFKKMLANPVIMTIAAIEFCTGFLRQAIMQWYGIFAKQTDSVLHLSEGFVSNNWGLLLCCAGILGGMFAGVISDRVFQSRRGPVAFILYAAVLLGAIVLAVTYDTRAVGWIVVLMSLVIIGVHGMLTGTASMDFGGQRNVGVAVGIIDGFVYLGTAVMALTYAVLLPNKEFDGNGVLINDPTGDPSNWIAWPLAMIPFAIVGTLLALRLWNAKPKPKAKSS